MLLKLDEALRTPKSIQILEQVRSRIESGALRAGERLPSTRHLAEQLGLHRSTVATAYQELWAQGWIELSPGAHPRVRARIHPGKPLSKVAAKPSFDWGCVTSEPAAELLQVHRSLQGQGATEHVISFRRLEMDPRLLPTESFRNSLQRVMRLRGTQLLGYGDREGYGPLREYLARRMQRHGISAQPEEILITSGSQQALDLMFRMIAKPGRSVAVELPTYGYALQLLHLAGLKPMGIPMNSEGMDLDALEASMRKQRPALVYTMPNFQNPTGICTSPVHREQLLGLCERHGVPILEDGFEEEMKYFGKVVQPIKALDRTGLVAYAGTFSKVLFPGIRIGWVTAPRSCIERLAALRTFTDLCPAQPMQAALHEFCERGHYDLHLSRMHRVFRKRMQAAIRTLRQCVDPAWAQWQEPNGGFLIWMKLKASPKVQDWERHFATHGVEVTLGQAAFAAPANDVFIRICISLTDEEQIAEGLQRLGRALAAAHA